MAAQLDFEQINETLKDRLLQFLPRAGRLETGIPGVAVSRYDFETSPERCLCSPMVAYVAQGSKRTFYGEHETRYGAGQCVVLGVDAPGIFQIRMRRRKSPF